MSVMSIAYELQIPEEEVLQWEPEKFLRWVAFLRIVNGKGKGKK